MPAKKSKPGPRYEPLLGVLRASEGLWEASRVFFSRWDLSPSQFNILNILAAESEGVTQVELSRMLIMHRSNMTGLIDRLEKRELVERNSVKGDRRANRICLTSEGNALVSEILPVYHAAAERVWGRTSATQAREIVSVLEEICANAQRIAESNREAGKEQSL